MEISKKLCNLRFDDLIELKFYMSNYKYFFIHSAEFEFEHCFI